MSAEESSFCEVINENNDNTIKSKLLLYLNNKEQKEELLKSIDIKNTLGYQKSKEFSFSWIYYSKGYWECLPRTHILMNITKENETDEVLKDIASMDSGIKEPIVNGIVLSCLTDFKNIVEHSIHLFRKLHLPSALNRFCPSNPKGSLDDQIVDFRKLNSDNCIMHHSRVNNLLMCCPISANANIEQNHISELSSDSHLIVTQIFRSAQEWKSVYRFVYYLIHMMFPVELFGGKLNQKYFLTFIKKILSAGRYDQLTLESLMSKICIKKIRWLKPIKKNFGLSTKIISLVYLWILERIVLSCLKAFFYITESSVHKNQIFFFRKKDWQSLHRNEYNKYLNSGRFHSISIKEGHKMCEILGHEWNSASRTTLRFLPKINGLRPILCARNFGLSAAELRKSKLFLKIILLKQQREFLSVKNIGAFQYAWSHQIKKFSNYSGQLYVVKVDVTDAFGSILHNVLVNFLKKQRREIGAKIRFGTYSAIKTGKASSAKYIWPFDNTGNPMIPFWQGNKPVVRHGDDIEVCTQKCLNILIKVISCQLVKLGNREFVLMKQGIAQGGSLSSDLCDVYYAHMTKKFLGNLQNDRNMLIRSVDDFLFITCDRSEAVTFYDKMKKGYPKFNCFINPSKTVHNLDGGHLNICFRGFYFSTLTHDILVNAASLLSCPPRYTMKLRDRQIGKFINEKIGQILNARFLPIVYDPKCISLFGIVSNIWRTAISLGGRISPLSKFLEPTKETEMFIFKIIRFYVAKYWRKAKNLWMAETGKLLLSKSFFVAVFFVGIVSILGSKGHPPLKKLRELLLNCTYFNLKRMSDAEKLLLPKHEIFLANN